DEKAAILGKLPCGTVVTVHKFSGEWANITYSGKSAYIKGANLKPLGSGSSTGSSGSTAAYSMSNVSAAYAASAGSTAAGDGSWAIGDEVIANGRPQYSSYGLGKPGFLVTDHKGKITHLNLKSDIPYPIHVDYLGWFAENQVQKAGNTQAGQTAEEKSAGKGLKISVSIVTENRNGDGKDEVMDCGQFELDDVKAEGPPSTVTMKATSLPYTCGIRQTKKNKSWEGTSLSGIAKAIAANNGLGILFESKTDPSYSRVEQYQMSDIAFLQKLCHDTGASLKATNNVIVIFDQAAYEAKKAVKKIIFGESGGYTKYQLETSAGGSYASCRVYYTAADGTVIEATEYAEGYNSSNDNNQCLEVRQKVGSVSEAQALAHKMLRLHNKFEYEASFTFPGDPALAAGNTVELSGFGAWDGKFLIKQAKHSLSRSGFTTSISLRKCLATNESISGGSGNQDSGSGGSDDIDELARQCIRGDWGNGQERIDKLTAAGHSYRQVQDRVNEMLYGVGWNKG
ncbi:MAG: contractile injection system protein, VgrG/Pvc8 family, partial [[Eubacterium] siraeum]|nr:contractile injection system protein, VgrG/Pvc8 family [[Eubacterium] siraeum]